MGMEILAPRAGLPTLSEITPFGIVVMVDGGLVFPGKPLPETWRDVRVKTSAGTVTLARREGGIAVVVFGNADEPLREVQRAIAAALSKT